MHSRKHRYVGCRLYSVRVRGYESTYAAVLVTMEVDVVNAELIQSLTASIYVYVHKYIKSAKKVIS